MFLLQRLRTIPLGAIISSKLGSARRRRNRHSTGLSAYHCRYPRTDSQRFSEALAARPSASEENLVLCKHPRDNSGDAPVFAERMHVSRTAHRNPAWVAAPFFPPRPLLITYAAMCATRAAHALNIIAAALSRRCRAPRYRRVAFVSFYTRTSMRAS